MRDTTELVYIVKSSNLDPDENHLIEPVSKKTLVSSLFRACERHNVHVISCDLLSLNDGISALGVFPLMLNGVKRLLWVYDEDTAKRIDPSRKFIELKG